MAKSFGDAFSAEQDTQKGKFLTFILGKEVYAIEIRLVTEIISLQPITTLPEMPEYIKGIVNLRGKIIPVMDIRLRLKLKPAEYDGKTCIVIIEVNDISVGLIVDDVSEVVSIADGNIVPPPDIKGGAENRFVKAIGVTNENVGLILDCEKIVREDELCGIEQKVS